MCMEGFVKKIHTKNRKIFFYGVCVCVKKQQKTQLGKARE